MTSEIDLVIPWVDGADPEWQKEKERYITPKAGDSGVNRYRDWDNLQYLFRGVEKFLPWIRKVHFVTWGHLPPWLNPDAPKLNIVRHSDYIPEQYLPVFSSHPIEMNFHRIDDLAEQFIYANDDMFFLQPLAPDFFFRDGLPVDACIESAHQFFSGMIDHIIGNDLAAINANFNKKQVIRENRKKWFSCKYGKNMLKNIYMMPFACFVGFYDPHLPYAYLKNTWKEVWAAEPQLLDQTSSDRVRSNEDVNQWLCRYWQFVTGKFAPGKVDRGRFFSIGTDDDMIRDVIINQRCPMICLSDDNVQFDFEVEKKKIKELFEKILPEKSSFER